MSNKNTGKKKVDLSTITTIKLLEETKLRIEKLREHKRESYDDILRKILYILNVVREDPEKSKKILERIDDLRRHMFEEERKQKEDLEKELNGEKNKENLGKEMKSEEKMSAEELVKSAPTKRRKIILRKRVVRVRR